MFAFGHVFNRESFLSLLDLEIKRARRYQNYLSLLSLSFGHLNPSLENRITSPKNHDYLLKDELRDSDIVGQGEANCLLVMLPHADIAGTHTVREKLEKIHNKDRVRENLRQLFGKRFVCLNHLR